MTTAQAPLGAAPYALQCNESARAEMLIRSRLASVPDDLEALRLLAAIATKAGNAADAERLLRSAIAYQPDFVLGHAALSSLLCQTGRADEALALLDREAARRPASIWPLSIKSGVLSAERRFEESLAVHDVLVTRMPDSSVLWMNYGYALKTIGHIGKAVTAYRRSLRLDSAHGAAWWGLANLRTIPLDTGDIRAMERVLPTVSEPAQKAQLQFALGKAFADQGLFAQSFSHYQQANVLRGTLAPYDPRITRGLVRRHEEALSLSFFAERREGGHSANAPIFLVGMPRSGSTLVEQMLACHPMVDGLGELFELPNIVARLSGSDTSCNSLPDAMARLTPDERTALGREYMEATRRYRKNDRPYFTDKMPANWRFVALVQIILPNARIVDVRRDPLSCCLSTYFTYFNRETSLPSSLHDMAQYHNDYTQLMDYVETILPGYVHRVGYERLVENPEAEVRNLLTHLGLGFDPSCLRFHESPRPVNTPSAQQVRRPIKRYGLGHWRSYEPWLGPLKAGLASVR